jgi:hypothetical protein
LVVVVVSVFVLDPVGLVAGFVMVGAFALVVGFVVVGAFALVAGFVVVGAFAFVAGFVVATVVVVFLFVVVPVGLDAIVAVVA